MKRTATRSCDIPAMVWGRCCNRFSVKRGSTNHGGTLSIHHHHPFIIIIMVDRNYRYRHALSHRGRCIVGIAIQKISIRMIRMMILMILMMITFRSITIGMVTEAALSSSSVSVSSIHESMNLFRCGGSTADTTTTTITDTNNDDDDRCLYGTAFWMHYFSEDNVCLEMCVYFTGSLSRTKYHCGKCPPTAIHNDDDDIQNHKNINITYQPGNLIVEEAGLILSAGLTAKIIATKDQPVLYGIRSSNNNNTFSDIPFHRYCDAGATFIDPRPNNKGGWIYVSNSEYRVKFDNLPNLGGVGAITFDKDGTVIQYQKILNQTTANCAGGKTPWNTWVSCEEYESYGTCFEVDPTGGYYIRSDTTNSTTSSNNHNIRYNPNTKIPTGGYNLSMSSVYRGMYESFAYDIVNVTQPHFYVTKDDVRGELRRYTPNMTPYLRRGENDDDEDEEDIWNEQHFLSSPHNPYYHTVLMQSLDEGNKNWLDFLIVVPDSDDASRGTYYWTTDPELGASNAALYYPNVEGIDVVAHTLYFISKVYYTMYILNLQTMTYYNITTRSGLLDGQPDQVDVVLNSNSHQNGNTPHQYHNSLSDTFSSDTILLYFTEDTNRTAGIHGRTVFGDYVPILQSTVYHDETVGLAFSPNYQYMYMGYQNAGIVFQISRTDTLPFYGTTLNVKYHNDVDNPTDA